MLFYTAELKTLHFVICSAKDLFTLNSNKFRMVYKVDGNPQLDTCDWSMYSNILNLQSVLINVSGIGMRCSKLC